MEQLYAAYQIDRQDNVATALSALTPGPVPLRGEADADAVPAIEPIPAGHKLALRDIEAGEDIVKYGVRIGIAARFIPAGSWVHLQAMRSDYDERSELLDAVTGAPKDVRYE